MALKKSELYSSLWSSCDELRGGMDAQTIALEAMLAKTRQIRQSAMREFLAVRI